MDDITLYHVAEYALCGLIACTVLFAFCCALGEMIHMGTGDHEE